MREKWQKQMPLMSHILDHSQSKELEVISGIIDAKPTICEHILQDPNRGKSAITVQVLQLTAFKEERSTWKIKNDVLR